MDQIINASDDARLRGALGQPHVVIVKRAAKRLKRGGIHASSKAAIIAMAREQHPEYSRAAVVEIFWGTEDTTDTVLRFEPTDPEHDGI